MKRLIASVLIIFGVASNAIAQENDKIYQDNVVIVIDDSGSMDNRMKGTRLKKMELAKTAIIQVLDQIPEGTNVGIVTFNNGVIYKLSPINMNTLTATINGIGTGGGTPLGEYMKVGADILMKQREAQFGYGSYRLLVVTDGKANDDRAMNKYSSEIVARGIILDAIGVDMAQDHSLARTATSYRQANDPESLKRAVTEVFAEVGGVGENAVSMDEAFAELQGFPDDAAKALLGAFRSTGNHPIGTTPAVPQPVESSSPSATSANAPIQSSGIPVWFIVMSIALGIAFIFLVVGLS